MNQFLVYLEKVMLPVAEKIGNQRHLQSIRDGLILLMPFVIIGSLFLIIATLPIPGYKEMIKELFGEKLSYPVTATMDIMGLIASVGIAYRLAERYKVDALSAGVISLSAFLLATPQTLDFTPEGAKQAVEVTGVIPVMWMGSKGIFVAMVLAILSTEIYRWFVQKKLVFKMPAGVPPSVTKSFAAIVPGLVVLTIVWLLRLLIEQTEFGNIHNIIAALLSEPLKQLGGSLIGTLIAVLLMQLFWSIGIHGDAVVGSVMLPVYLSLMDENRKVFEADPGADLPNVITSQFIDLWINMGGSGTTFALVFLMLFAARSRQMKGLGRVAIGPGLFNINEPVIFGTPIVMNPLFIIPFILTPIAMVLVTYFAMSSGLVGKPTGVAIPWTTPILFSGYLATGKISGSILQVVNFFIALAIYYPFFRIWDRQRLQEEKTEEKK
ncbi:PTS cellobiose transporter subunit IIC [Paenactinomyces guangxiensis]|uniref:Permease IIC component n=1 Tax=Paenactinomyces guangxiensis TaxID=1490290 RepID=A0A7W1WNB9_9BACL|nr:PTS cellobiose transporter subunit IIC [Paenactinomyces guangxiensis]MBA4492884.1 PTS cellobiose transporter subunit IIC [Paenactinomyces guangxiensis]MBH8590268.1 PTS cellobiose transporter subunit IIC [Paenactinomyces guangxiensis]